MSRTLLASQSWQSHTWAEGNFHELLCHLGTSHWGHLDWQLLLREKEDGTLFPCIGLRVVP